MPNRHIDLSLMAQVFTLVEFASFSVKKASETTGIACSTIFSYCKKARELGFDSSKNLHLQDEFFESGHRSGRPIVATEEVKHQLIEAVKKEQDLNLDALAAPLPIGRTIVAVILKQTNIHKCKPSMKPGLMVAMKLRRLEFCLEHVGKGIEFWKTSMLSDKTSVVLGHRRGGYRLWRTPE